MKGLNFVTLKRIRFDSFAELKKEVLNDSDSKWFAKVDAHYNGTTICGDVEIKLPDDKKEAKEFMGIITKHLEFF